MIFSEKKNYYYGNKKKIITKYFIYKLNECNKNLT